MPRLSGKNIILAVTGGIAAYKACDLASRLVKEGAYVTPLLTKGARRFVTPYTFEALTGAPCLTRLFKRLPAPSGVPGEGEITAYPHIDPARNAHAIVIAPATAGAMARIANGLSSDLLSAMMLSVRCPVFVCPSMNVLMWEHAATQRNVELLKSYGYTILGPCTGDLACGMKGAGRLMEPAEIVEALAGANFAIGPRAGLRA